MRPDRIRLDKWLWHARFARTRPAAAALATDGHVRIAGKRQTNAAHGLKPGDVLTIAAGHGTFVVEVLDFGTRRGDADTAARLYRVIAPLEGPTATGYESPRSED